MDKFAKRLDTVIAEGCGVEAPAAVEEMANDLLEIAAQLQENIGRYKRDLQDAEMQLDNIVEQLNTKLGWEIRKRQPKMMIAHKNGKCHAGYFSQNLALRPNLQTKEWAAEGPLAKKFITENPDTLALSSDPAALADAIVKFFTGRFRTLS
jgi:alanine-alpha-ketoisovalerate/valine-pyruvate aminotransferase